MPSVFVSRPLAGDCPGTARGFLHRRSAKFAATFKTAFYFAYLPPRSLVDPKHAGNSTRNLTDHLGSPRQGVAD
jgi:hypothetical protein